MNMMMYGILSFFAFLIINAIYNNTKEYRNHIIDLFWHYGD